MRNAEGVARCDAPAKQLNACTTKRTTDLPGVIARASRGRGMDCIMSRRMRQSHPQLAAARTRSHGVRVERTRGPDHMAHRARTEHT